MSKMYVRQQDIANEVFDLIQQDPTICEKLGGVSYSTITLNKTMLNRVRKFTIDIEGHRTSQIFSIRNTTKFCKLTVTNKQTEQMTISEVAIEIVRWIKTQLMIYEETLKAFKASEK